MSDGFAPQRNCEWSQFSSLDFEFVVDAEAHQAVSGGRHQLVGTIETEDSTARVQLLIARPLYDEQAIPLNCQIGGAGADLDGPLREIGGDGCYSDAEPSLSRVGSTIVRSRGSAQRERLQELGCKDDFRRLEADGLRVGEIVSQHVDLLLSRVEPSERRAE